jgi:hypothetical protein
MILSLLKKIIPSLFIYINKNFQFIKLRKKVNLIVVDDTIPDFTGGWRIAEFEYYADKINDVIFYTDLYCIKHYKVEENFYSLLIKYREKFPKSKIIIKELKLFSNINAEFAYCIFFNNILRYFKFFEKHKIPFGYTLYPGGGFGLNVEHINKQLLEIHNSKYFRFVVVNQKVTLNYLIENNLCEEKKIKYIPSSPIDTNLISINNAKRYFSFDKSTFDIAFIANKYSKGAVDKGFDIFCKLAHKLDEKYCFFRYHVVGDIEISDIPENININNIEFYGRKPPDFFNKFFESIDVLISPNKPNILAKGSFDGFPLGSSILAGINGVLLMLTDELKENTYLEDETDFILIKPDVEDISSKIEIIVNSPEILKSIGNSGKNKLRNIQSEEIQLKPRLEIIKTYLC